MSVRVLVAENDQKFRNQIRETVGVDANSQIVGLARDGQEAIQMALQLSPQVAILSYDLPGISGPQACEILSALAPDVMTVLISDSKALDRVETAMRAGARAVLAKPFDSAQLELLVTQLATLNERRGSQDILQWRDPTRFPKIVTVTGAKGGIGKSTVAVNLAVTLAKEYPGKVALIDLYTQFGDIATMFNVAAKRTIAEMVSLYKELDTDLVQNYVTAHPSGVHVLITSDSPLPLDAISTESLDSLLYTLKRMYRYIVVDMPPMLYEMTLHVLSHSNNILLIANLFDLTTATDTKKFYDALRGEHIATENIGIVLNRVAKTNRLHTADLERMFDSPIVAHVPNDLRLVTAVNDGMPFVYNDGESPFGQSMAHLARRISGAPGAAVEEEPRKKKKILGIG